VKRILILTASFGEGHNAAARGIRDALARVAPSAEVEMRDLFRETYGRLNDLVRRSYMGLINNWPRAWGTVYRWLDRKQEFDRDLRWFAPVKRRLADLLARLQPDVVISVFPSYSYLLPEVAGAGRRSCRRVVVVTDSITVNAIWYRCHADYFLVPNEQSAVVIRTAGINSDAIRIFGFPVSPRFADLPHDRPNPARGIPPRVLYMIHAGTAQAPELVRRLCEMDLELTVTVGRDEKLRNAVKSAAGQRNVEIIGWTEEFPELLSRHHLLIGKAGGATVQETIAAGCPMIINHVVSGQEEGNAQLIVESSSGAIAHSPAEVAGLVRGAFADDAKQWREWAANISHLSRPRASLDIAEWLITI
jgi:processive 1,2-diacylglycerol beta-glucosyltransferase